MSSSEYQYLNSINVPADLRKFEVKDLRGISREVRDFLIDVVSKTGGHLGAGLGTVELTVALHYVFNTPEDKIVWDTGHQAYPHKILTGRRDRLHTIRKLQGLSGFLKRTESEYDEFGAGHATTSISAALGIAIARDRAGKDHKVVAVIGDGAMTGGMAYEAMNNCGLLKTDIIVILNDNRMSIAPNVWALHNYFSSVLVHPTFQKFKKDVWSLTGKLDSFGDRLRSVAHKVEAGIKSIITPGMLFEALGFKYFGPFNGHNVVKMVEVLRSVKDLKGPILVHVITEKGKGYAPAEADIQRLHGVTPFDKVTGQSPKSSSNPTYTKIFGQAMVDICTQNPKVIGVTAAMPDGTGLDQLAKEMPDRFFDVGIAEQHGVTFAAGLATQGFIPVCAIYSTFLQRAIDQTIHDVAIQHLHVVYVLDRGGLVGADGPTHHGALDLTYLRMIPGMVVMAPKDEQELRDMLYTATEHSSGPIALRYPRGNALGVPLRKEFQKLPIGKAEVVRKGRDIAILAIGNMVDHALKASNELSAQGIDAEVVNMRFVKPIDSALLRSLAERFTRVVTVEDNSIIGGFGSAVVEEFANIGALHIRAKIHGIPDRFIEHGTPTELHAMLKLDPKGIAETAVDFIAECARMPAS